MSAERNPPTSEARAASFLQLIRRSERGRLKVYLGYCPGVGKTCRMLEEGHRLRSEGVDVAVGLVETHGREGTIKLVEGLPAVAPRGVEYKGIRLEEMDLAGVLSRKPQVVLVDELAHTNVPGSSNAKRWEDVEEILAAGIHVITTVNVQHLESLRDTAESIVGTKIRERVPDSVIASADQVVNVDLSEEDLLKRLRDGRIYPPSRVEQALGGYFQVARLERLREIALRELASNLDRKRREGRDGEGVAKSSGSGVAVALRGGTEEDRRLLRQASRIAGRLSRDWYAVHVRGGKTDLVNMELVDQRSLEETLSLAHKLGASVVTLQGDDVAATLLAFAEQYGVGHIVVGRPRKLPWWRRLLHSSVAENLVRAAHGVSIEVCDVDARPRKSKEPQIDIVGELADVLSADKIRVWDDPVTRDALFAGLVDLCMPNDDELRRWEILDMVLQREKKGSTFLAEGVALPHARVEGLDAPIAALGITRAGVLDDPMGATTEVVLLLLAPMNDPSGHLRRMAAAARVLRDRDIRRKLSRGDWRSR
jgi:two-component system, OmpR family, sensor histidine kinase KdpD